MSKLKIGRSRRDTAKRRISVDSIGSSSTTTTISSSGSDTDSSVSSLSSEDSLTKLMATSHISIESDDDYDTGNNNYNDPYGYRNRSYSMPWKTTLSVSHSGRLKEKKKLRSPQHNCATVLDNEIFMPLERTTHSSKERTVRFAV